MITIEKSFPGTVTYPLKRLGDPKKLVFFDIETTGFSFVDFPCFRGYNQKTRKQKFFRLFHS